MLHNQLKWTALELNQFEWIEFYEFEWIEYFYKFEWNISGCIFIDYFRDFIPCGLAIDFGRRRWYLSVVIGQVEGGQPFAGWQRQFIIQPV